MANAFQAALADTTERETFFEKTGEFVTKGIAGSVISAGTSFYNTGVALGNAFGADLDKVHTEDAIADLVGDDYADYYRDNQELVDTVGLVAGSFLPGLAAVKAARFLAAGTLTTKTSTLATAIREVMIPAARVDAVKKSVMVQNLGGLFAAERKKLLVQNLVGAAAESAIFEAATLLTMNQSSALNREDVGYFEAIGNNLDTALFGVAMGTGIGGLLGHFTDVGKMKAFIKDAQRSKEMVEASRTFASGANTLMGDEMALTLIDYKDMVSRLKAIEAGEITGDLVKAEAENLRNSIVATRTRIESTMNHYSKGNVYGSLYMDQAKELLENGVDDVNLLETFGGAAKLRGLSVEKVKKSDLRPNVFDYKVIDGLSPELKPEFTAKYMDFSVSPEAGLAQVNDNFLRWSAEGKDFKADLMEAAGFLRAEDLKALMSVNSVRVNKRMVGGKLVKGANGKNVSTPIKLRGQLEDFLDEFAPEYKLKFNQYLEASKLAQSSKDAPAEVLEALGKIEDEMFEMADPRRMFAAFYKIVNAAELDEKVAKSIASRKEFSELYQWASNNHALRRKYGTVEAIVEMKTGKALNREVTAGITDLGQVNITSSVVSAGRHSFKVGPGIYKYSDELAPVDASAQFAWAVSKKGAGKILSHSGQLKGKVAENLSIQDLPTATAIFQHYDFATGAIQIRDLKGVSKEISSAGQLQNMILQAKRQMIIQEGLKGADARTVKELEHLLDVDEEFILAVQAGVPHPHYKGTMFKFRDQNFGVDAKSGFETYRPNYMVIEYSKEAFNGEGVRGWGSHDIFRRIKAAQQYNDDTFAMILGEDSMRFVEVQTARDGTATIMDDMTSQESPVGFLTSANQGYTDAASVTQTVGAAGAQTAQRRAQAIADELAPVATAVMGDKAAQMEVAVLEQSVFRSGKYKFLARPDVMVGPGMDDMFQSLGIDFQQQLLDNFLSRHGFSKLDNLVVESKIGDQFLDRVRTTMMQLEDSYSTKVLEAKTIAATTGDRALLDELSEQLVKDLRMEMNDWSEVFFQSGHKVFHEIKSDIAAQFWRKQVDVNRKYLVDPYNLIAKAEGQKMTLDPDVIYPGKFDSARFRHVAFVKHSKEAIDPWAAKGQGMIVAHSEEALQQKIRKLRTEYGDSVEILTNQQKIEFAKAQKRYDADLAVTDEFVDSNFRKEGRLWNTMPEPDPNAVAGIMASMQNQTRNIVRRAIKLKYGQEIETLKQQSKAYFPSGVIGKADSVDPFQKQINEMLFLPNSAEHTWWSNLQEIADKAISRQFYAVRGAWTQAKTTGDWEAFQKTMDNYGLPLVYKSADEFILSNASAPKPLMNKFVAQANGVFAHAMLRLDPAQWVVNAMATPIMLVPEIKNLVHSFGKMDAQKAKRLGLALSAPIDDLGNRMPSNQKIMMQAVKNLWNKSPAYLDEYKKHGIVINMMQELRQMADDAAINPKDVKGWGASLGKVVDKLGRPSDWSEQFCKFVAADSARQVLEAAGVPKNSSIYWSTIRTFVNNVTGNYYQAQRPGLFQGWAGQAIGLFQTYQFNLIQRFFRHIEDGDKAAKYLLGIQAATFGTQSLPGFQLLNQHIGERATGEKDFYSVVSDSFDSPVAEFLLYGAGSSLTRPLLDGKGIDFYSRGDLTPRTPILIPTSFEEIPIVNLSSKFISNIGNALDQAANGVDAKTVFLNALAANGVNRPISGAAQMMQGYRTTHQGNMITTYPEVSWATAIAKLMGTRDMDESIAVNSYHRSLAYRTARMADLDDLATNFKAKIRQDGGPDPEDLQKIMEAYVERGGRIETFSRWMKNQYTNAADSTVNKLRDKLNSPEGRYLQSVMGAALDDGLTGLPKSNAETDLNLWKVGQEEE